MSRRHKARELLVQALYATAVTGADLEKSVEDQIARRKPSEAGENFVREYAGELPPLLPELDEQINAVITGWSPERVGHVERSILQLALFELRRSSSLPPGAVLDEAIELARTFGGDDSARFVNGVLDRLLTDLRQADAG